MPQLTDQTIQIQICSAYHYRWPVHVQGVRPGICGYDAICMFPVSLVVHNTFQDLL